MDDLVEDALDRDIPPRKTRRPLWVEEPVGRPRMPDPVRRAAVRAVLVVSFTLIAAVIAMLGAAGESWLAAPAMLTAIAFTVVAARDTGDDRHRRQADARTLPSGHAHAFP
ncbi:hypothetical protein ACWCWB_37745, partial [Actinacidiphila glaucinigra]